MSCWHLHQLIAETIHNIWIVGSVRFTPKWTKNEIVGSRGGHVPQCLIAGDATGGGILTEEDGIQCCRRGCGNKHLCSVVSVNAGHGGNVIWTARTLTNDETLGDMYTVDGSSPSPPRDSRQPSVIHDGNLETVYGMVQRHISVSWRGKQDHLLISGCGVPAP